MEGDSVDPLFTVLRYKRLAEDSANHTVMLTDKTIINFLIYVLDSSDEEVLTMSLSALELLSQNKENHTTISSTGLVETLQSIVTKQKFVDSSICKKAEHIIQLLNTPVSPEKKMSKKNKLTLKKKVLTLQVHGLHLDTQKELEDILTKIVKGVHSVIVDVEHQRCVVTVFEHVDPKVLASAISDHTNMEVKLVTKNQFNQEMLVPLNDKDKSLDLSDLPPYLDEKDSPVKDKAIRSTKDIRITASEWFSSAAGFLQKSFYW